MAEYTNEALLIKGSTRFGELAMLEDFARKFIPEGGKACEIGADGGRSTWVLAKVCEEKNAQLYVIDIDIKCADVLDMLPVTLIEGDSRKVYREVPEVDFTFIDGDHTMPTLFYDIINMYPKTTKFICGHDYYPQENTDVKAVVDNLKILEGFKSELQHSFWWKEK